MVLRKVFFIEKFLYYLEDKNVLMFSLDEMGIGKLGCGQPLIFIGTKPLRSYSYSHIGSPAVLKYKQLLGENLTATTTISTNGVKFI